MFCPLKGTDHGTRISTDSPGTPILRQKARGFNHPRWGHQKTLIAFKFEVEKNP